MGAWDGSIRLKDIELQSQRTPHRGNDVQGGRSSSGASATTSATSDAGQGATVEDSLPSFAPFVLLSGRIGELVVTIPYMSFWRRHCKLAVKGLRIRMGPMDECHWGYEGSILRERAEKQAALVAEELRKVLQAELSGDGSASSHPDSVHERNNKVFQQMAILLVHSVEIVLEDTVVEYCDEDGNVVGITVGRVAVDNAEDDAGSPPYSSKCSSEGSDGSAARDSDSDDPGASCGSEAGEDSLDGGTEVNSGASGSGLLISKTVEVEDVAVYILPGGTEDDESVRDAEWIGEELAGRSRIVDPFDARLRVVFNCNVAGKIDSVGVRSPQQPQTRDDAADAPPRGVAPAFEGTDNIHPGATSLPLRVALLNVRISDIKTVIAVGQIECVKRIVNSLDFLALKLRFGKYRPPADCGLATQVEHAGDAARIRLRALWRYAINATLAKVWQVRLYISREYVNSRCRRRRRYIQNYKLKLAHRNLLHEDLDYGAGNKSSGAKNGGDTPKLQWFEEELLTLEGQLTVPDIMHFRALAETELMHITSTSAKESKKSHNRCARGFE